MHIFSPCGIDCQVCDAYIATQNHDSALFAKLAEQYKTNIGEEIDPLDLRCDGCMNQGNHISFCCQCEIRSCAISRSYENCAQCEEFPCQKGEFIWKEGSQSLANLRGIQK